MVKKVAKTYIVVDRQSIKWQGNKSMPIYTLHWHCCKYAVECLKEMLHLLSRKKAGVHTQYASYTGQLSLAGAVELPIGNARFNPR